jgi:hypothetical protein
MGLWKKFRIKEPPDLGTMWKFWELKNRWVRVFEEFRFKELLVVGISKTSKNHQVYMKEPNGFRQTFDFFSPQKLIIENHG